MYERKKKVIYFVDSYFGSVPNSKFRKRYKSKDRSKE